MAFSMNLGNNNNMMCWVLGCSLLITFVNLNIVTITYIITKTWFLCY